MSDFPTHTIDTAPAAAKPILEGAQKSLGFVPNLFATMAEAPALLEGYTSLAAIFDKSDLSATERQIILMTNNRLNGCSYCMAAHTTIAQGAGVPADVIDALRTNTPIADAKLEALRQFSIVVNESRGWPSDADIEALTAAGYSRQTALEVVLGTAVKVLSNYTNHIAETDLDAAFAPNRWSEDVAVAA
ncbi:carboxymuconolactone decarboxylase family protein [Roseobacter sinensis]|uniref:Carboxymuconolactone decarboxylase family protein n=1 Tax=Roseobacter sinensis TaxID=2931391 RepID=A0ABT3BKZ4_9RHOB|nr:carboxymuconolactone decarboxylase family protein [Roseobacter sp. WL0113]MCV3274245.1 carboxymuconolactone decarboxylase family protein [Roseobacter sp. WL0113]